MKQIVLIKQSASIQLAHLYEHIFCTQVDALFMITIYFRILTMNSLVVLTSVESCILAYVYTLTRPRQLLPAYLIFDYRLIKM